MIITLIFSILYVIACSAIWRFRGGGIVQTGHTQLTRAITATFIAAPVAIFFANPWLALLAPAIFVGLTSIGYGDFYDMTHTKPGKSEELVSPLVRWIGVDTLAHDIIGMGMSGTLLLLPSAAVIQWQGGQGAILAAVGALMGPLYWMCWKISTREPTAIAEWVAGAMIGAGILAGLV